MSEGLEGMGRRLKVAALDDPEGPLAPRTQDDPTKSDEFDQDELARKSPGYLQAVVDKAVADAVASYEAKLAEKNAELNRRKAAEHMLVRRTDELQDQLNQAPETKPALKARPVSIVKRSDSMKWQTIVIALLCAVTGTLVYRNDNRDDQVNALTAYYLQKEFSSEAMNGKTFVEVTQQVENIGINRFIPLVRQLPYTDAAALERLFGEENWVVTKTWSENTNPVVQLSNWHYNWFGCLDKELEGESTKNRLFRSVIIHPHPVSIKVYLDAKENEEHGRICAEDFAEREHYAIVGEDTSRLAACAALAPPVTRTELAPLGTMRHMWNYGNVLFLVAPYGADERFVRIADTDEYRDLLRESKYAVNRDNTGLLRNVDWNWWWENITEAAIKEEQTAVK